MPGLIRPAGSAPVNRIAKSVALKPIWPVMPNCRIEVRLGDADLGGLRGGPHFGGADIGPAAEEIGRDADADLGGRTAEWRPRPVDGGVDIAWRHAEQHGERVLRLGQIGLERRNLGLGVVEKGGRLLDVEFGGHAVLEAQFGDASGFRSGSFTFCRTSAISVLQLADRDIGGRDIADEGHAGRRHSWRPARRGWRWPPGCRGAPGPRCPAPSSASKPVDHSSKGRIEIRGRSLRPPWSSRRSWRSARTCSRRRPSGSAESDRRGRCRAGRAPRRCGWRRCCSVRFCAQAMATSQSSTGSLKPLPPFDRGLALGRRLIADGDELASRPGGLFRRLRRQEIRPDQRAAADQRPAKTGNAPAGSRERAGAICTCLPVRRCSRRLTAGQNIR